MNLWVLIATLVMGIIAQDSHCTVAWCCGDAGSLCHVINATWSSTDNTCTCECDAGYFSSKNNTQCLYCGGRGISFNETSGLCDCENKWSNQTYCNECVTPYGGDDCDRCEDDVMNSTFPACDVCIDGYFTDPARQNGTECLTVDMCTVEWCEGDSYPTGSVSKAAVVNKACICTCEKGWYGDYNDEHNVGRWGACYFCSGHGTAYHNFECNCSDMFEPNYLPWYSCSTCPMQYNSTTCDRCATPASDNEHYTDYPECKKYYVSPESKVERILKIVLPIVGGIVLIGFMYFFYRKRNKPVYGRDNNQGDSTAVEDSIDEHPYQAMVAEN